MDSSTIIDVDSEWKTVWTSLDNNWKIDQQTIVKRFADGTETRTADRTSEGVFIRRRNQNRVPDATKMLRYFTDEEIWAAYHAEAVWHLEECFSAPADVRAAYARLTADGHCPLCTFAENEGTEQ